MADEPTMAEMLDQVKLRALHVQVIKLLRAKPPVSMPADFAEALALMRLIQERG
jgi:hypothetical protein